MKYVKKPVVIEAFRLCHDLIPDWFTGTCFSKAPGEPTLYAEIETLEGTMRAERGDYIIKGLKGELYPCKADIFEMTYNPISMDFKQRIKREKEELDQKLIALNAFLAITNITGPAIELMLQQKLTMTDYSDILGRRLE